MPNEINRVHTEFSAEDKNLAATVNNMTGALGQFETATKHAKDTSERNLKEVGEKSSTNFKKLAAGIGAATIGITGLSIAFKSMFGGGRLAGMFGGLGSTVASTTGKVRNMTTAVGGLNGVVGSLISTAVSFSAAQVWGGVFGAGAIAMMHRATAAAEMYQKKLKEVNFVLNSTSKQSRMVDQTITQLGIDTPFSMNQSADAVYLLASSFGEVNKTLAATPAMMDLTLAGNMQLTEGANLMIQGLNMFNMVNGKTRWELKDSSRRYADVLTKMQSISPFVMREFNPAFSAASRVISSYNQSLEGTLAVMAMLKKVYPTLPAMAGFGLQLMMPSLSNARKEFERITGKGFLTAKGGPKDLMVLVTELSNALGLTAENVDRLAQRADIRAKLQKIFPSEYQLGPFLSIIKGDTKNMQYFFDELKKNSGGFARKFRDDMINTVVGMKRQIRGSIETMWIDLGKTFQPFQQALLTGMFKAVNVVIGFLQLPLVKYFVAATLAVTAFAGATTLLVPLLMKLAGVSSIMMARGPGILLTKLGTKLAGVSEVAGTLLAQPMKLVASLFGIVGFETRIFAIAGAVLTFAKSFAILYGSMLLVGKLFPEIGKAISFVGSGLKIIWGTVIDIMNEFFASFASGWKKAQQDINGFFGGAFKALGMNIKSADDYLTSFAKTMDAFVNSDFMRSIYTVVGFFGRLAGWIGGIGGRVLGFIVALNLVFFLGKNILSLFRSWGTVTREFFGIFKGFGGVAAKGLGFIISKLTGIRIGYKQILDVNAANNTILQNTKTNLTLIGKLVNWLKTQFAGLGSVAGKIFGPLSGPAGVAKGKLGEGLMAAVGAMRTMFAKAVSLLNKTGFNIHNHIISAAKVLYNSIVGGFQTGLAMAQGRPFTPVVAEGPMGMIRGTTMMAGAAYGKKFGKPMSGGAPIVSHTGGPSEQPIGPVVSPYMAPAFSRGQIMSRYARRYGRFAAFRRGAGGLRGMGGGGMAAMGIMMAANMVPWGDIFGEKAGGAIEALAPLTSLLLGPIGIIMAAIDGVRKLMTFFGGLMTKFKAIAIIAGGIAAIVAGILAAPATGGVSALAGVKIGVAAIGSGLAVAGATSKLLARKQEEEIPHLQNGGIILRGGIAKVHKQEIFKPAKAAPLPEGGGLGDVNISMPINFNGNVVGELPDEFYETVQTRISRIVKDNLKYSYS